VAIVSEIKKIQPDSTIEFITDKRYFEQSCELFKPLGVVVTKVSAGKLRRYANLKPIDHVKHIFKSYLPNIVDMVRFGVGVIQSYFKILGFKPDVIFIKGGYVGLPVGLAAAKFFANMPVVLHDSDAHPGLTNRILSKYASKIGVGMPLEFSEYDKSKTEFVGVPIDEEYFLQASSAKSSQSKPPTIFVMGGSQGSRTINDQILNIAADFAGEAKFLLVAGQRDFQKVEQAAESIENIEVLSFISEEEVAKYMKESAIVITRAGATTMAEIAAVGAASIIVPSPYLASDHQTKNAEIFDGNEAAFVVYEKDLPKGELAEKINILLHDEKLRQRFSKNIKRFSKPNAAKRMAEIVIGVENEQKK
jgi:UDP-N-acetylglucosamine--N-acetylmuramyl-(pentapeptide) pyrophosphoryl-undecaprenol N-acetylglucosamine transferase